GDHRGPRRRSAGPDHHRLGPAEGPRDDAARSDLPAQGTWHAACWQDRRQRGSLRHFGRPAAPLADAGSADDLGTDQADRRSYVIQPMNIQKYTEKAQEAIVAAQQLADRDGHPEVTPEHVLLALVEQQGGIVPEILRKLNADPTRVAAEVR